MALHKWVWPQRMTKNVHQIILGYFTNFSPAYKTIKKIWCCFQGARKKNQELQKTQKTLTRGLSNKNPWKKAKFCKWRRPGNLGWEEVLTASVSASVRSLTVWLPSACRCSRVYWSTTDARKRCVYTCKIVECRPPVVEPDINSTVEHDENRTIAHSPPSFAGYSLKNVLLECNCFIILY